MRVQCCVCKKLREGHQWVEPDVPIRPDEDVSHGYCPICAAHAFAQIRNLTTVREQEIRTRSVNAA